jgi:hypothetical protein
MFQIRFFQDTEQNQKPIDFDAITIRHEKIAQELRDEAKKYRESFCVRNRKNRLEALKRRIDELVIKLRKADIDISHILGDR